MPLVMKVTADIGEDMKQMNHNYVKQELTTLCVSWNKYISQHMVGLSLWVQKLCIFRFMPCIFYCVMLFCMYLLRVVSSYRTLYQTDTCLCLWSPTCIQLLNQWHRVVIAFLDVIEELLCTNSLLSLGSHIFSFTHTKCFLRWILTLDHHFCCIFHV